MRILFCTGSSASYMAPPQLSDEQVNCGPDWIDRDIGGHVLSLSTPEGDYDLRAVASRLPAEQQPDAVICLVDAAWRSTPRNLKAFRCPKILLVADTHHLRSPIAGMIRYAQSEPFDRVVLLYDRHHWEFFHAAGIRQLYWFPGLTFPHGDRAVTSARRAERVAQFAFVGQTGICHPRRIQMLTHLNAGEVPVVIKALGQRESLGFYGSSLAGFNASLNGDLNLRVFEIMASGAMLLTDKLSRASGLADLWTDGRELVTYGSPQEMIERAQDVLRNPSGAKTIGDAGARWFDENFTRSLRQKYFQALVSDGTAHPLFALPKQKSFSARVDAKGQQKWISAFEYIQELHRNLNRVTVALDESVSEEFSEMCTTLPRVELTRGLPPKGTRVDFLVVGRSNFQSTALAATMHLWPWEATEADRVHLVRRCSSMGLSLVDQTLNIFSRQRVNTHTNQGAVALVRLEQGAYDDALFLANAELTKNPKSVDALIVAVELAQERGDVPTGQSALGLLRSVSPHHPRVREILNVTQESLRTRRCMRLARVARSLFESQKWADAVKAADETLAVDSNSGEARYVLGRVAAWEGKYDNAVTHLSLATQACPENHLYWFEFGRALQSAARMPDALGAFVAAVNLDEENFDYQLALGLTAIEAGHGAIAVQALEIADRIRPDHPAVARWKEKASKLWDKCDYDRPRDLLLSHVEVTRLQGTGVLLERFFPDSSDFITVRSRTLYKGAVEFSGAHFSLDLPGLSSCARGRVLSRILAPYRIRRILCVPFFASDFVHAIAACRSTGAPLCTYVMDDQVLHSQDVPHDLAQQVFDVSSLRLAISPEMLAEYTAWFQRPFGLLPPIVTTRANENPNCWSSTSGSALHCALVGNIWSAKQFEQLRNFVRAAGLRVDWFGNANVAWLPQDKAALERDGIFRQGFLPEDQLAKRLALYPFVLLPSGTLDGTEDNEWLTRLSLPSRMVFILTKTLTPMFVLGNARTAAAAFVRRFGLGTSSNYDVDEAKRKIEEITSPKIRETLLENARKTSAAFLFPACGEWIWRSLAAGKALPTPFDSLYQSELSESGAGISNTKNIETAAGPQNIPFGERLRAIATKLSDQVFLDSFLPPDEPRQRVGADVRGGVRFLQTSLASLGGLVVRLSVVERLAKMVPNSRDVLVTWAELLEEAGDLKAAAAKARQALSLFYDDVYTQTLFVRCVGDVNFHQNAQDRFCPHPFENFEIYKDGAVFPCNCTQIPFPIGNAYKQTAEEIWQSPQAKAIRASILDGSFRYCSPMTCYKRFDLPKKADHPEQWERLKAIGIEGREMPKHLNLSYDLSCNLSCPSCRNATIMATQEERKKLEHVRDNIVLPLLANKTAESAYITGSGDAFGSPHFRTVLRHLCDPKFEHVKITLGTNAQLLTPRLWEELRPLHSRFRDITVSIDGATPESYERHRRGSTWEKLQISMGILANARRNGHISRLMVNMVVQQDNFMEMRPLLVMCKNWSVDGVRFYRIRQWGNVVPDAFMSSDVANPLHLKHSGLMAELEHPIFADPIVDHYDMFELIERAQSAAGARAATRVNLWDKFHAFAAELDAAAQADRLAKSPMTSLNGQHTRLQEFIEEFGNARDLAAQLLRTRLQNPELMERLAAGSEPEALQAADSSLVVPGIESGKTAATRFVRVSSDAVWKDDSIRRLAEFVRGKTVGFVLHGASVEELSQHTEHIAAHDVVWVGLNHFKLLEDRLLKPAQRELSVVFCCADGEVQRRMTDLKEFLQRPASKLLITRKDHADAFGPIFRQHKASILTEQLPPVWPYPNSLTLFLRMLVQAGPRRIVLFGCDGYLGSDDNAVPSYFGSEVFAQEKRPSRVLLDTLLTNAHMPRILSKWREELGEGFPEIVNCSPQTLIRIFSTIGYDQLAAALSGRELTLSIPPVPSCIRGPDIQSPTDPSEDLVACFNAGRSGDLGTARRRALDALWKAPKQLSPFAQQVLQTCPRTIAAAYYLLRLASRDSLQETSPMIAELAREIREIRESVGDAFDSWEEWEAYDIVSSSSHSTSEATLAIKGTS